MFFFFNVTATTEFYTLSLHDALPICSSGARSGRWRSGRFSARALPERRPTTRGSSAVARRSEEHTSELQSRGHLVCRLLLEKKKDRQDIFNTTSHKILIILTIHTAHL